MAEVIENGARPVAVKFQDKFIRDIKELLDEHKRRNMIAYIASIERQKRRLLREKLRRLELRVAQQNQRTDLFQS
jgi:hypothetical protein